MTDTTNNTNDEAQVSAHLDACGLLDTCGLFCPEPVMLLHNKIRDMKQGEVLELVATDPSTTRDVPKFCLFLGHELIGKTHKDDRYHYLIRKK